MHPPSEQGKALLRGNAFQAACQILPAYQTACPSWLPVSRIGCLAVSREPRTCSTRSSGGSESLGLIRKRWHFYSIRKRPYVTANSARHRRRRLSHEASESSRVEPSQVNRATTTDQTSGQRDAPTEWNANRLLTANLYRMNSLAHQRLTVISVAGSGRSLRHRAVRRHAQNSLTLVRSMISPRDSGSHFAPLKPRGPTTNQQDNINIQRQLLFSHFLGVSWLCLNI